MKQTKTSVVLALVLSLTASGVRADAVDDYVATQMKQWHIPGVAVAVIKAGKPVKVQGYGHANLELQTPVTPESVFKIGSVSKQFIASGIMLLAEERKLSLDDKISKYLDAPPATWEPITIKHLLTHTSGLTRESPGFDAYKIQSDADVIKKAYVVPLQFVPGEKMVYCNLGYFILAEVITKTSSMPWPEFMEKRVFGPAGMTASRPTDMKLLVPQRANGYVFNRHRQYENAAILLANRPSGAFLSSLADLVKWERALASGSVVSKSALETMWQPTKLSNGEMSEYGYGWEVQTLNGRPRISHGGSLPGFRSFYLRLPQDDLTVIVLGNSDSAMPDTIGYNVAAHYVTDLFPKRTAVSVPAETLQRYTGRYQFGLGRGVGTVALVDGQLSLQLGTFDAVGLVPESPTVFFFPNDRRIQLRFDGASEGKLEAVYLVNGEQAFRGPKMNP